MTKNGFTSDAVDFQVEVALKQCEAALLAIRDQLLCDEGLELINIASGFSELREQPYVEQLNTVYGGLTSFSGRLAVLAKLTLKLGHAASETLGACDSQPLTPTLN
ncbi:hypothetical protein [Niveibacterium sp.]|uniref:hypothetical protein n=1 Tax=Niveibacterium sp. TaxID=2017444 RepID=UPI0035B44059